MIYTIIKKERLNKFRNKICKLNFLKRKKNEVMNTFGLKAYDYSKIKVMAGNGKKLTDQERAVLSVEKYDHDIRELEADLKPEKDELEEQIEKVDGQSTNWRHAEALRSFYLFGESKQQAAIRVYGDSSKQDIKNFNDILKTALEFLSKVSKHVDIQELNIEDWKDV